MDKRAVVIGAGIAGLTCAHLLAKKGWAVEIRGVRSRSPVLVLNEITINLLSDLWQLEPICFSQGHKLTQRYVAWGGTTDPISIPQTSLVMRGDVLNEELCNGLLRRSSEYQGSVQVSNLEVSHKGEDSREFSPELTENGTWVIDASGRQARIGRGHGGVDRQVYGSRHIIATHVELADGSNSGGCRIASIPKGWVFLTPTSRNTGCIQAMVPTKTSNPEKFLETLVQETPFIKSQLRNWKGDVSVFEASPALSSTFYGSDWIGVGDAAIALDPLCGDGTGWGLRGAIWCTAILDRIVSDESKSAYQQYYSWRLHQAFREHLKQCVRFYSQADSCWFSEVQSMEKGIQECSTAMGRAQQFSFGLQGLQLVEVSAE